MLGLPVALCSLCSNAAQLDTQIVNGTDTTTSVYPSYARLYLNEFKHYGYCGGTFIDATHVLTAAHCVEFTLGSSSEVDLLFTVVIPNLDDESDVSNAELHYVSKFYIHGDYDNVNLINDIAILVLETAVNVSGYAQFSTFESNYRADGANETFVAVGHGNTATGVDDTSILQKTTLTYLDNTSCDDYQVGGAPDSQLCMSGDIDSGSGLRDATCQGDSGGPLYWASGSGKQVGITSYGPLVGCGDSSVEGTSVFTEITDYKDWIDSVKNGEVNASYITSESHREYYRENGHLLVSSGSGGSGGAVSLWSSLLLVGLIFTRRRKGKYFLLLFLIEAYSTLDVSGEQSVN